MQLTVITVNISDFNDKVKLVKLFYDVKENELGKDAKLVYYDILSSDEHLRVYTRIFYDEILALVADESLLFENMHFTIDPIVSKFQTIRQYLSFNGRRLFVSIS